MRHSPYGGILFLTEHEIAEIAELDDVLVDGDALYALTLSRPSEFTYRQKRSIEQDGD